MTENVYLTSSCLSGNMSCERGDKRLQAREVAHIPVRPGFLGRLRREHYARRRIELFLYQFFAKDIVSICVRCTLEFR